MIFIVNDTDFSGMIKESGYTVTPRKITGQAAGTLLSGEQVADQITTKRDLTVVLESGNTQSISALATLCLEEYVNLIFSDPISGETYQGVYMPQGEGIPLAIDEYRGTSYWYGFSITFKER